MIFTKFTSSKYIILDEDDPKYSEIFTKLKYRDKRTKWFTNSPSHDELTGNIRGRRGKKLHQSWTPLDSRYFDPNVLRIGDQWAPTDKTVDYINAREDAIRTEEAYNPSNQVKARSTQMSYSLIPISERCHHPEGLIRVDDACRLLNTELKALATTIDVNEIDNSRDIEIKVKQSLRHAHLEQVDGGEYGPEPPLFDPNNPKFGSIDKTDKYSKLYCFSPQISMCLI